MLLTMFQLLRSKLCTFYITLNKLCEFALSYLFDLLKDVSTYAFNEIKVCMI